MAYCGYFFVRSKEATLLVGRELPAVGKLSDPSRVPAFSNPCVKPWFE